MRECKALENTISSCSKQKSLTENSSFHYQRGRIPKHIFIYTSIYLSIYLSTSLPTYLSIYLSLKFSIYLYHLSLPISIIYLYLSLSISIYIYLQYLSIYLPTYLSICLSIYLTIYLPIYLSTYLSNCPSISSAHISTPYDPSHSAHLGSSARDTRSASRLTRRSPARGPRGSRRWPGLGVEGPKT